MREVTITSVLSGFGPKKSIFYKDASGSSWIIWDWH